MVRIFAIALLAWLTGAAGAMAGEYKNPAGKFSLWLPDPWTVKVEGKRIFAQNPKDTIEAVAHPLDDADADLVDEDVVDFIDDELDSMKVEADRAVKHGDLNARRVDGTGKDGPDDVVFRALAIDPGGTDAVIEVVVYGDDDAMDKDEVKQMVEHILRSLHPL
jgi:hypothetical protein